MGEVQKIAPEATTITPMSMIEHALNKGADVDQLTKLMDLQERWEAAEAKKAFVAAMSQFQAACPTIDKTEKAHNSKYASLAGTLEQIRALMTDCGLSHSWKTAQDNNIISVSCVVTHRGGHSEETTMSAGADTSGSKNSIQAIGSTVSYLQRYTLSAILGLASKEHDDDGNAASGTIEQDQLDQIKALIEETGADIQRFCEYLKVGSLADIKPTQYRQAIQALEAKRGKK